MAKYQVAVEGVMNYLSQLKSTEQVLCSSDGSGSKKKLILYFEPVGLIYGLKVVDHGKEVLKTTDTTEQQVRIAVTKYNSLK